MAGSKLAMREALRLRIHYASSCFIQTEQLPEGLGSDMENVGRGGSPPPRGGLEGGLTCPLPMPDLSERLI